MNSPKSDDKNPNNKKSESKESVSKKKDGTPINHEGHRGRLMERFLNEEEGLHMEDYHLLELLCFFAIPRVDCRSHAVLLLEQFGSLRGVFSAPYAKLQKVKGVGPKLALLIRVISTLMIRIDIEECVKPGARIDTEEKIQQLITGFLAHSAVETTYAVMLDNNRRFLNFARFEGSFDQMGMSLTHQLGPTLKPGTNHIILAHSHPDGTLLPSIADIDFTERLRFWLNQQGMHLVGHYIVCGKSSMLIPMDSI